MNLMTGNNVLSPSEVRQTVDAACQILEKTGIEVKNADICAKLAEIGASVSHHDNRIRFGKSFVEKFISESLKADWDNRTVSFSAAAEIYQGYFLDPVDDQYKEWTEQRLFDYVKLAKTLSNMCL